MTGALPQVDRMSFLKGEDMGRRRGQRKGHLRAEHGSWLLTYRLYDQTGRNHRETVTIGPANGPGKLTEKQAERFAWDHYLSKVDQLVMQPRALMSVAEFWEKHYKPWLTLNKRRTTRDQYFSLWRRWIEPILGKKRLATIEPGDVERVVALTVEGGKSQATAKHVRKVISAIYTKAKKLRIASGDNPASLTEAPDPEPVREKIALPAETVKAVLAMMAEPIRTMALTAVITSMNASELCGLRWKHVNLTPEPTILDNESLAPFAVAVRQHFTRGEVGKLKTGNRRRDVPIPESLVMALATLKARPRFNGPDDAVFCSRRGTPISENNTRRRIFGKVAKQLGIRRLSWHVFRYSHATFTESIGMHAKDRQALMGHGALEMTDRYTVEDHERMRGGLAQIAEMILPAGGRVN